MVEGVSVALVGLWKVVVRGSLCLPRHMAKVQQGEILSFARCDACLSTLYF